MNETLFLHGIQSEVDAGVDCKQRRLQTIIHTHSFLTWSYECQWSYTNDTETTWTEERSSVQRSCVNLVTNVFKMIDDDRAGTSVIQRSISNLIIHVTRGGRIFSHDTQKCIFIFHTRRQCVERRYERNRNDERSSLCDFFVSDHLVSTVRLGNLTIWHEWMMCDQNNRKLMSNTSSVVLYN